MYTTVRMAQAAGLCGSGKIDLFLAQKYILLQGNSCLLGYEKVMETQAEFHFSWVYIFSAMLSSWRNWANHDRYRLAVAIHHSCTTVLIIHQTATSSKTIALLNLQEFFKLTF